MNCLKCGQLEQARVKVCTGCGQVYASQDLQLFRQLEFLLQATAGWSGVEELRLPYQEELEQLRKRLVIFDSSKTPQLPPLTPATRTVVPADMDTHIKRATTKPEPALTAADPVQKPEPSTAFAPEAPAVRQSVPAAGATQRARMVRGQPKVKEPFDEWLLSERNIKLALYGGGLLLFIAGIIFVGVNWARFTGPVKFTITVMITALTFFGGYLLYRRPAYRLGGTAILGLACGFLTLNFAILQIYVTGPQGMATEIMWFIASPFCLIVYFLIGYWTRQELFGYMSIAALASLIAATLVLANVQLAVATIALALFALALFAMALSFRRSSLADFTFRPALIGGHLAKPLAILLALFLLSDTAGCTICPYGNPWIIIPALFAGLIFYAVNAYWLKWELFTYISLFVLAILIGAILVLSAAQLMVVSLVFATFALTLLVSALLLRQSQVVEYFYRPLLYAAQGLMPLSLLFSLILWAVNSGCTFCQDGTPWIALLAMAVGVVFYAITNLAYQWLWSRWAAVSLFSFVAVLALTETGIDEVVRGLILMVFALVELIAGYWVGKREGSLAGALPFYVPAGALAILVTILSLDDKDALIKALLGDVVLLGVAAWILRDYRWVYGAVWLFMLPVYLLIDTYVDEVALQGLLMGSLGLIYVVAGYLLGRREKYLAWPFLTAAVFLSLETFALTWQEPWIFSLSLAVMAVVYGLMALWLAWPILLIPALLGLDFVILGLNRLAYDLTTPIEPALAISYAFSGTLLLLCGLALSHRKQSPWAWGLYLVGALDLALAYGAGLVIGEWLAVLMSAIFATFLLAFAWLERGLIEQLKMPPVLAYLACGVLFGGLVYLLQALGGTALLDLWPVFAAALCAFYVGLGYFLRQGPLEEVYGLPLEHSGLLLLIITSLGALVSQDSVTVFITFFVAGCILATESILHKSLLLAYLAAGAFLVVIWAILLILEVSEVLAYVGPASFVLLGLGWSERRQGRITNYMLPTILGLAALMGSTFVRSVMEPDAFFALLLLLESVLAFAWGLHQKVRCYIQAAGIGLVANALVQLGPGFMELHRWIQLALIGTVLLGAGLLALFRRQEILDARHQATDGWRRFGH